MRACPNCKRPYPPGWEADMRKRQGERIKAAAKVAEKWGRPRKVDYDLIYDLRAKGLSIMKIADRLKCSLGAVQHALRKQGTK